MPQGAVSTVTNTGVAGIQPQGAQTNPPSKGLRPFRQATLRKRTLGASNLVALTASQQALSNRTIEGVGFLEYIDLHIQAAASGVNAAAVAYNPDAPWNALSTVVFQATGTDVQNLTGYSLYLANLYGGFGVEDPATSLDPLVYNLVTGAVATGGDFNYRLRVPLAINPRSLMGLMGNQSANARYELLLSVAPSADIFSVAPTFVPNITVTREHGFCTVPAPQDAYGVQQEQAPGHYGIMHTMFEARSEADVVSATTVNHYLRGIGNTVRYVIMIFRDSTGARSDLALPDTVTFYIGNDPIYTESSQAVRQDMRNKYGFDAPAGVLVYSFDQDFAARAGFALGDDNLDTRAIPNAYFRMSYPTLVLTPGSVTFMVDQLVVPSFIGDFHRFA